MSPALKSLLKQQFNKEVTGCTTRDKVAQTVTNQAQQEPSSPPHPL